MKSQLIKFATKLLKMWYPNLPGWVNEKLFRRHFSRVIAKIIRDRVADYLERVHSGRQEMIKEIVLDSNNFSSVITALSVYEPEYDEEPSYKVIPAPVVDEIRQDFRLRKLTKPIDQVLSQHDLYEPAISDLIACYLL